MKGLYVAKIDVDYSLDIGVAKKIDGQIKALKKMGLDIDYLHLKGKTININDVKIQDILAKHFAFGYFNKYIKKTKSKYDFVYIRYARANVNLYRLVKYLYSKGIKVIIEIPTYPYRDENNKKFVDKIDNLIDDYIIKNLKKYVYRISTTNNHDEIFGIKTVKFNNGVDEEIFPLKRENNNETINLVGIANIARWHGYDRIIRGLATYYCNRNTKKVNFYIVGEGKEKANLIKLVKDLKLDEHVCFLGAKTGKDLDKVFDSMDIGVSSLALFRAGGGHDPIKSKEFLMRGMPVILSYEDKLVNMELPYVLYFNENDDEININDLVNRYDNIKIISSHDIRDYAKLNLSWYSQMKNIKNCLNEEKNYFLLEN